MRKVLTSFFIMLIACLFVVVTVTPYVMGQEEENPARLEPAGFKPALTSVNVISEGFSEGSQLISLELRNIDIVDVLKILSQTGALNIVAGRNVRGNTTIFLDKVAVGSALKIICEINNLAYIQEGNIIKVITEKEFERLYGIKFSDKREQKVIKLYHTDVAEVNKTIKDLKSKVGTTIVDERTNSLIIIDTAEAIKTVEEAIDHLDVPIMTKVFQLKYIAPDVVEPIIKELISKKGSLQTDSKTNKIIITEAPKALSMVSKIIEEYDTRPYLITKSIILKYAKQEDIEGKIKEFLTKDVGTIQSDKRSNTLTITDYPEQMVIIEEVIEAYDAQPLEVLLDVKVVTVNLHDQFRLGFNIQQFLDMNLSENDNDLLELEQHFRSLMPGDVSPMPRFDAPTTVAGSKQPGSNIVFTNNQDVEVIINALKEITDTKLISEPRLTVVNNEEAKIQVGTNEPYVTSSVVQSTASATTAEDVQFIDVGVLLSVTPTINDEGFIVMKIKPEVSQVTGTLITASGNNIPIVRTSELETTIMVEDGKTVILGGLIEDARINIERKVPFLGSIPIIGAAFRDVHETIRRIELLVFITPTIISGDKDLVTGITRSRRYLKDLKLEEEEDLEMLEEEMLREGTVKEMLDVKHFEDAYTPSLSSEEEISGALESIEKSFALIKDYIPKTQGRIVTSNQKKGYVVIDLGKQDGIMPGQYLNLYTKKKFVDRLPVSRVFEDSAILSVTPQQFKKIKRNTVLKVY